MTNWRASYVCWTHTVRKQSSKVKSKTPIVIVRLYAVRSDAVGTVAVRVAKRNIHTQYILKSPTNKQNIIINRPVVCTVRVCVMQLSLPVRRVSSIVSMLDICVKCIIHWWEWNKYVAALFIVVQFSVLLLPLIWKSHRCVNIIIASHSAIKSELDIGSPCRRCSAHLPRNYPSTFCIHFIQLISAEIFCCPKHMTDCARPRPFTKLIDIRAVIRSAQGSNVIN